MDRARFGSLVRTSLALAIAGGLAAAGLAEQGAAVDEASAAARTAGDAGIEDSVAADSVAADSVAAARARLLDLGLDAASAIPVDPHERDRAKALEVVARAALALGDVPRAERAAEAMTTWRQGAILCELAIEAARRGDRDLAERLVARASALGPRVRDWQRDRIRVAVARAQAELGATEKVRELEALVGEAERGKVVAARAASASPEEFDALLAEARRGVDSGSFDAAANALETCIALAAGIDGDERRWAAIESVFAAADGKVAREIAIRATLRLADVRIADGARPAAAALVARARSLRDAVRWAPESELPLTSEIARRMAGSEGADAGLAELERGLAEFKANEARVADVFRATALAPAAEALVALGATERGLEVFRWAIEAGALNPNARPRAEDLAQTCAAIARARLEPDAATFARLDAIRAGLVAPW